MDDMKLNLQAQVNVRKVIIAFLFSIFCNGINGQEAFPAAGGNFSGSEGSVSYSVGQVVYMTSNSVDGIVSEGVQQTYEISIVLGLNEAKNFTLTCSVYPNPVVDYLTLRVDENYILKLSYQLYTSSGKIIEYKVINSSETSIFMGNLAPELYFLRIFETHAASSSNHTPLRALKIFKIIKTN
jgi:hypothetical protein